MTPVYLPDKTTMLGFIMVEYDEPLMRVLLPGKDERMPTAQELLDYQQGRPPMHDEIVVDLERAFLTSQRTADCGADFITVIWIALCEPGHLLHLPRELFQTVPEAFGYCRTRMRRN